MLTLSDNRIGSHGVEYLANALYHNKVGVDIHFGLFLSWICRWCLFLSVIEQVKSSIESNRFQWNEISLSCFAT